MQRYHLDDIVLVKGYGDKRFIVTGYEFRDRYFYKQRITEHKYHIKELNGYGGMIAFEEDMVLYQDPNDLRYEYINEKLDEMNIQIFMYKMFKDEEYIENVKQIDNELKDFTSERE